MANRRVRTGNHQWAVGAFCAALGALMLVTPHQFSAAFYAHLQPHLPWWGLAFLVAGAALITVPVLHTARALAVFAHFSVAAALLLLAWGFAVNGAPTGPAVYAILVTGTAAAPFLRRLGRATVLHTSHERPAQAVDLLVLVLGIAAAVLGIIHLALPQQFMATVYDPIRSALHWHGAAFLVSGGALLTTQLLPAPPTLFRWAAHVVASGSFLAYCALVPLPARNLTGVAFYGGFGVVLLVLPWLTPRLLTVSPRSLRTRLALTNVGVAAVPLIFAVTLLANQAERAGIEQSLRTQRLLAEVLAREVYDYVGLHRAAVSALSTQPMLLTLPPAEQRKLLTAAKASYPDIFAFALFDYNGRGLARSDDRPLTNAAGAPVFEHVRQTGQPSLEVRISGVSGRPIIAFGFPVYQSDTALHAPSAILVGTIESATLAATIARVAEPSGTAYLVDGRGRTIAHPDATLTDSFADLSYMPPVAALVTSDATAGAGALSYPHERGEQLAGYARVPVWDWGVIVEQPIRLALGNVRTGRDIAAVMLLTAIGIAGMLGLLIAGRLARPLASLSQAMDDLATGQSQAPLPQHGPTEVRRLTHHFREMRRRLTAAAAEQQRLLESERDARETAEQALRQREQFLSIAAHELKTPVTSLRAYAQLSLRRLGHASRANGAVDPTALRRALETIDHQSARMARLTEHLLDVSRMDLGRLRLDLQPTDLAHLVRTTTVLAQARTPRHTIEVQAPNRLPAHVDRLRLEQVLDNLLDNAIKYSPDGGSIEVSLTTSVPGLARLSVRDHGLGIPPERREMIFDRFYQAHDDSHRSGLGLGLWISREIVRLHGGTIEAEFPANGGVRFVLTVPTAAADLADAELSPQRWTEPSASGAPVDGSRTEPDTVPA